MLFQEISTAFWRRAVFMDCDVNTLMSLIQTNKFMYERRKYLYHLCFIRLIKSFTIHEFYTCIAKDTNIPLEDILIQNGNSMSIKL